MKHFLLVLTLTVMVMGFTAVTAMAVPAQKDQPVAEVMLASSGISWVPKVSYDRMVLTIARPNGSKVQKTFDSGSTPYMNLSGICGESYQDGSYTFEIKVIPQVEKKVRKEGAAAVYQEGRSHPQKPLTQTGYFWVAGGMIVTPASTSEDGLSRTMDIVHADDVIIDGSLCVGNDCYSGLDFGFDTIALMENNLRIFFDDTSTIQNYPRNDWRIIANDSTDGGGNYFAIEDATEVSNIFVLEAGAPDNSLYVDSHGDVGINTSTPYYELHIVDGDSPCVRLDQDGSYGWTPQKWDVCGNESNFFIRDATHASKLPFRIEPDAPTDSIFVKSSGYVGLGTGAPAYPLELETTGANAEFVAQRISGASCYVSGGLNYGFFGTKTNHPLRLAVNGSWKMEINGSGHYINMSDGGYYDGTWHDSSSRKVKEDIYNLTLDDAAKALDGLTPVRFHYKANKEEEHVGFIAEDVPELVATKNRNALSPMDITAVLTRVVQEQQRMAREQQKLLEEQQATINQLMKRIEELEKK